MTDRFGAVVRAVGGILASVPRRTDGMPLVALDGRAETSAAARRAVAHRSVGRPLSTVCASRRSTVDEIQLLALDPV